MLERIFISSLRKNPHIAGNKGLIVAVSGGKDSMVLLDLVGKFRHHLPQNITVATLNHGIRKDSVEDVGLVIQYAQQMRFPVIVGCLEHKDFSDENTLRLQRQAFLLKTMADVGADRIWTAHHADDAIETMLQRLGRGSGLMGVVGLSLLDEPWGRPLLYAFSEDIAAYREKYHIPYRNDSTNFSDDYERNKIRLRLIPFWSGLVNHDVRKTLHSSLSSMEVYEEFVEEQCLVILGQLALEHAPKMLKLRRRAFLRLSSSSKLVILHFAIQSLGGKITGRGQLQDAANCIKKKVNRDFGSFHLGVNDDFFTLEVR